MPGWNRTAKLVLVEVHGIDHPDDCSVDGRIGPADGSHGGKAFGSEENALTDACVYSIQGEHGFAAIGAVQIQGLNEQDLAPLMRGDFSGGN